MTGGLFVLALLAATAEGENLLGNPSFETLGPRGLPQRWDLFVQPMAGAHGEVVREGRDGGYAVMLHNPREYERDPVNNWSQTVVGEFGGTSLRVSGYLKTDEATEAAIWIQCWRRSPPRVLAVATTSLETPVWGTRDWTHAEALIDVPEGTDFLVLRCVLKGRGTAWFDDLRLEEAAVETVTPPLAEAEREPEMDGDLREAISALRESNDALRSLVAALHEEVQEMRGQVSARPGDTSLTVTVEPPAERDEDSPPLPDIPAGVSEEERRALEALRESNDALRSLVAALREEIHEMRGQAAARPGDTPQKETVERDEDSPPLSDIPAGVSEEERRALEALRESNETLRAQIVTLQEAIRALELRPVVDEDSLTALRTRNAALQRELEALHAELEVLRAEREARHEEEAVPAPRYGHPLVPRGYTPKPEETDQ